MGSLPRGGFVVLAAAAAGWSGCAHARPVSFVELAASEGKGAAADDTPAADEGPDAAALATRADLPAMLRLALVRAPELLEARARVEERLARLPGTTRLPDLELKAEGWGVPLAAPYALGDADTLMLGVRQAFPAYGSRDADARAALEDARAAYQDFRARRLDVVRELERAYLEYYLAGHEYQAHAAHLELSHRVLDLSRDLFRVGRMSEDAIVRLQLEVSEQHRDLVAVQQRQRSAAAMLNTLMGRAPDATLGPADALPPRPPALDRARLEALALANRPELAAARHMVLGRRAGVDRAERAARWPTLMLGLDYMYMPDFDAPHRYGAMISINLPWLNGRYDDDLELARRGEVVEARALERERRTIRYELADAWARYEAAQEALRVTSADVLPAAQRRFDTAQAGFAAGRGDALALLDASRMLLDVRVDQLRAEVALAAALVDLERAVGGDLGGEGAVP